MAEITHFGSGFKSQFPDLLPGWPCQYSLTSIIGFLLYKVGIIMLD